MGYKHYTDEQKQFLKDNCNGKTAKELTYLFNCKFNTNKGYHSITQYLLKLGIHNALVNRGRFKKGGEPWNKGIKTGLKPPGMFKIGNLPKQTKPKGYERINKDGFIEIKIDDIKTWKLKHRYIYEKYYNVKLSKHDKIIFLDGNNFNFDIENLKLIKLKEQIYMSRLGRLTTDIDINKTIINIAKLNSKISDIKKNNKKENENVRKQNRR